MPCSTLRHWVSLYGELLFRQELELQEHLYLNESTTHIETGGFTAYIYTTLRFLQGEEGGGHTEGKGLSSKGELVKPENSKP